MRYCKQEVAGIKNGYKKESSPEEKKDGCKKETSEEESSSKEEDSQESGSEKEKDNRKKESGSEKEKDDCQENNQEKEKIRKLFLPALRAGFSFLIVFCVVLDNESNVNNSGGVLVYFVGLWKSNSSFDFFCGG